MRRTKTEDRAPQGPRRHRNRRRRVLVTALVAFLAASAGCIAHGGSPVGGWRSERGKRAYASSYAAAMALLPPPSRARDVPTDFGTVRVYEFASAATAGTTPIVLLPGRSSGVPMWSRNLPDLAAHHVVYALDALGDAGMSVQTRRIRDAADQAAWLDQVLAALGLSRVHLVGHSFGGWLAANYATRHPGRLASLVLLEPVLVFQGLRWQIYLKSVPATVPFLPRSWREAFLRDVGGGDVDPHDPVARMISDATEHYADALPLPGRLDARQLRTLHMPVYVAMAANSSLHDSAAAVRVARQALTDVRARCWPDATHSLPMEHSGPVDDDILAFAAAHP